MAARFLPGWVMVSTESGRLLENPDQLAVDLADVRHDGNGVYTITTGAGETIRLINRVGPLPPGRRLEYGVDFEDDVPTVVLTLSERLAVDEVAPALARVLAESTAPAGAGDRVFSPGSTPDLDAVQRPADAGFRAELRQRGRLLAGKRHISAVRQLALTMGVADGQPNAALLRTLLTEEERTILDRAADPASRPLEDRVDRAGYLAKALGGSGVSAAVIGTAAAVFTGNPLVGLGIAVPTIVNAGVGSIAERRLDEQKASGRKPAYTAERKQREYDFPGLRSLLDGAEPDRPAAAVKMPRATAWRNYLRRYAMPTLATAAVAGVLTPLGVPALSTAMVIASSALAKSLAERLVDTKKLDFRLRRIDATERLRLADPTLYVNQLVAEFTHLQARLDHLRASTQDGATAAAEVPGSPPYAVALAAQLIENVSGSARRALLGGKRRTDADPSSLNPQLESLLSAAGPGLLGAVMGAMGDKYFLNRDEPARDASKQWSRRHQEAAQAAELAGSLEPQLRAVRELVDHLEERTGTSSHTSRDLPTVTTPPDEPRPSARAPWSAYAVQAAAGSLGGVAGAVGLDLLLDLPDLAVVLTAAGAAGSTTATPVARYLFRSRELQVHESLESNKAVRSVNQAELLEQRAITRYLITQLALQAEAIIQPTPAHYPEPEQLTATPTDQIRTATTQAVRRLAAEPPGKPLLAERLIALEHLTHTADALDHHTLHGTPDSQAHLQTQLNKAQSEVDRLYQQAGLTRPEPVPKDELARLRTIVGLPPTPTNRPPSTPTTTRPTTTRPTTTPHRPGNPPRTR
ncbi:hypothetical protein ACWF0M_21415 [Kribbella sp. NPDC055110]